METFSISSTAAVEICRLITASKLVEPAVSLSDSAPAELLPDNLRAVYRGKVDEQFIEDARRLLSSRRFSDMEWRLDLGVYERRECSKEDLVRIDGILFAMPLQVRLALQLYRLDFRDARYVLVGPDEVALSLSSVKAIRLAIDSR